MGVLDFVDSLRSYKIGTLEKFYRLFVTILRFMEQQFLTEYRCACGKLLFRGLLLLSVVEVKCKRCGRIGVFREDGGEEAPFAFAFSLDAQRKIVNVCRRAPHFLGYKRADLIGKPLAHFCPPLAELAAENFGRRFEIKNNVFLLRDGGEIPMESYFISRCDKSDAISGYDMISWVMPDKPQTV